MKISYLPQLFRMPGGASGSWSSEAAGATPWGAIAQAGIGAAQTIGGWIQQHKATKALEKLKSPTYNQNQGILDFYNKALSRYGVSPQDSALYKRSISNIDRGVAGSINALQDRRSSIGGISNVLRASNDAKLNAEVAAENEKDKRFGVLGNATELKAGEDEKAFQYNQYMPYKMKADLLASKASGGGQIANSGLSNIFNSASSASQMAMLRKQYGG